MTKEKKVRKKTPREEKLFDSLLKITYEFVKGKHYTPVTQESLLQRLQIHPDHFAIFDQVVKKLKEEGKLQVAKEKYLATPPTVPIQKATPDIVVGVIKVHPRGFGFVEQKDAAAEDVFIPKTHISGAIDGDTVEVLVQDTTEKGPEGKVISIIQRKRKNLLACVVHVHERHAVCYSSLLGESNMIHIPLQPDHSIKFGDRIIVEVVEWGQKNNPTRALYISTLGSIHDASKDIDAALVEFEIRKEFPPQVAQEAQSFGTKVKKSDLESREDLRKLTCVTIDPDTAKDYDDAVSLTKENGLYVLGVHIADVSHYVTPGSALDNEAMFRMNSTYLPRRCIPMLPHELSDNLCSLKEGVVRLTVSVFMHFDKTGEMRHYHIVKSYIKSSKRFTYKEAKAVLDGKMKSRHSPLLHDMVQLVKLLKIKRKERGSVELYMPELFIHVDENGNPTGTERIEYDITHQMIEEFMLRANETVATHLSQQGKNLTYRIHEEPSKESLREFSALAHAFGYKLSPEPTPHEIQKFFLEAEDSSYAQYLATCYIKSMKLACYSADNIGHYGLGLTYYCHFTSPIRRYVDVVAHRLLFSKEPTDKGAFDAICKTASEQERLSARAENSVMQLKKLRLLSTLTEGSRNKQFECVVTRVKPFGIYFDIIELMLEGFLHVSELENDYFVYDDRKMRLMGSRYDFSYMAGDVIYVMVKKIDLILKEASWQIVASKTQSFTKKDQGFKRNKKRSSRNEKRQRKKNFRR